MNDRRSGIRALSNGGGEEYPCRMAFLWKLLVLIAVLIMPFGMSAAPASNAHHAPATSMPMGHCPDQGSRHDSKGGIAECTMACAAALPAAVRPPDYRLKLVPELTFAVASPSLHGLHPDTATPPPKLS